MHAFFPLFYHYLKGLSTSQFTIAVVSQFVHAHIGTEKETGGARLSILAVLNDSTPSWLSMMTCIFRTTERIENHWHDGTPVCKISYNSINISR